MSTNFRRIARGVSSLVVLLLLAACGGGDSGGGGPAPDPNRVGAGWITISGPSTTDLATALVSGEAFVSPTWWSCCTGEASDTGVTVTWSNATTGTSGAASQTPRYGWFFQYYLLSRQGWSASIPVALGSNVVTATATDPSGNLGRASVTVIRTPDVTPPTISGTSPLNQATGVPHDASLSATFSEPMDPITINASSFVVLDSNNNAVPGTVTYTGRTAKFDPSNLFASASTYTAKITSEARDLAGSNPLASNFVWTFSTGSPTWLATSTNGAPYYSSHTAVWDGTHMIVWSNGTGASYRPTTDDWQLISSTGAPSGRLAHSAVWTGSEMIVWGGLQSSPSDWVNTGGRYSPVTDSWQPMSTENAPSPRDGASAIWTGTEMVVWGGLDPFTGTPVNTGASYNPLTDTWRPVTTTGAPSGRNHHTAVWAGTEMLIWGGYDVVTRTNTGGRYDPATDSWQATAISNAPSGRYDHSAVWTGSQMIIWGGSSGEVGNPSLSTGGRYDPATDSWQVTTTVGSPSARTSHTAIWTGSEMFVWGGYYASSPPVNTGGRYNPSTNKWSQMETSGAPSARFWHTSIWTGTLMVVWGGHADDSRTGGRFIP